MPVLSPEPDNSSPPSGARRFDRYRGPGFPGGTFGVVAIVIVLLLAARGLNNIGELLPGMPPWFGTKKIDRTGPAVLKSMKDLHEYRAASGTFSVVVDVEQDTKWLPDVLRGERTAFLALGSIDAGIDFSALGEKSVDVSDRSVKITLPEAQMAKPVMDVENSRVINRKRGVLDRVGSIFSDSPTSEKELYAAAEPKLREAAYEQAVLGKKAEENTQKMLTGLLTALGFEKVEVVFTKNPG
jgi:hypothetical protein